MLVLTRRVSQRVLLSGGIEIMVVEIHDGHVRLGIKAPPHVTILREEIVGQGPRVLDTPGPESKGGDHV